ncbi:lipocalin-like domain-containing protein [Kitasatospora purpeofusca]|uniref:lipocalin-like domain-containing protein n=1 Tax=Kitasatospora purpeofusca TaxID=67352 RepID=UPI002E0EA9D3|nr:lipocalin-like domain-containing protein [Kitasatospora purpeofusca]WSR37807.1 lipocalin-like domain-containing protein [Kitasatospora purpeofusca]
MDTLSGIEVGRVIGAWQLVALTATDVNGAATHPLGTEARGMLIYTPDGHVSAQIAGPDGYIGYAGTYQWLGDRVVHRSLVGSPAEFSAVELPRTARLEAGRLSLASLPANGYPVLTATWQRVTPAPDAPNAGTGEQR